MLDVRLTTVTIAARPLQSAGLIRYRRGLIQVVDRAALEDIACECYGVVKHNVAKSFLPSDRNLAALRGTLAVDTRGRASACPSAKSAESQSTTEF